MREIIDFVTEQSGPERAESLRQDILEGARRLLAMPGMGHLRADLTSRRLRFWRVHSYLIVYRFHGDTIEIARVVSGRRDLAQVLEEADGG